MPTFIFVRNPANGELTLVEIPAGSGIIAPQPGLPGPDPTTEGCSDNPINTICGFSAGTLISTGTNDTLFGVASGSLLTTEGNNTLIGHNSGFAIQGGVGNSFLGSGTATGLKTGSNNVVVGNGSALNFNGVESRNLILYSPAQANDSATIRIGEQGVHETKTFIKGIHSTLQTGGDIRNVTIDVNGHMGTDSGGGSLIGITDTENTALGIGAMDNISSGDSNVVMGFNAFNFATTAGESVILGSHACENLLNTGRGIFIGANSGLNADMTSGTVAIGYNSLQNLSGSTGNTTCCGFESLQACTSGGGNSAFGALTLKNLTTSVVNTAVGRFALTNIKDGCDSNTGIGSGALTNLGLGVLGTGVGSSNTAVGMNCMGLFGGEVAGNDFNTGLGRSAGHSFLFGSSNLYLGHLAGSNHGDATPGENNNILLMSPGVLAEQNTIHLGNFSTHTDCFVAGISSVPSGTPVVCLQDPTTGQIGAGQIQMTGSGDMSMVNSMDVNGTGQILLQTSQVAVDAIKLNATAGGIQIDATGLVNLTSTNANSQALKLVASNANSGILISANTGGIEQTCSGPIDIQTSVNMAGTGITIRSTGVNGRIEMDSGLGGVRIVDGGVGLFMEDTSSLFAIQFAIPTMVADYKLTYPSAQASTDGQALVNDSSGNLRWDNPVSAFPNGWINNLGMTNGTTTDTDKDILAGECRDDSDVFNIVVGSTLTVDNTVSGVNGLDTGSLTANTWYAIFVIADTTLASAPASLMSLSDTSPTLPGTYDVQRRVGWARTDGSSDFYKAFYGNTGQQRIAYWDESETILEVLTDGSAILYTVVDCSEWVPPVAGFCYLNTNHFASDEQDFLTLAPTNLVPDLAGLSAVSNPRANRTFGGASAGDATGSTFQFMIISDDQGEILYANSSASEDSDIWVIAYLDALTV